MKNKKILDLSWPKLSCIVKSKKYCNNIFRACKIIIHDVFTYYFVSTANASSKKSLNIFIYSPIPLLSFLKCFLALFFPIVPNLRPLFSRLIETIRRRAIYGNRVIDWYRKSHLYYGMTFSKSVTRFMNSPVWGFVIK